MTKTHLLVVPCDFQGQAPEWLRILPLGMVELRDSRAPFEVTPAALTAIVENFRAGGVDLVVDYEHQSLTGDKAPAAGWIKDLAARSDGLYARIEWTATALRYIQAGEYRYYSPVLQLNPESREPSRLMHLGLTNVPAIKNLAPLLAAKYRGFFGADGGTSEAPEILVVNSPAERPASQQQEEAIAMLKELIEKMGLKPETTEAEVLALVFGWGQEVVALKAQTAVLPEIAQAAGLEVTATASQIKGAILALKQGQDQIADLKATVTALETKTAASKAETAVTEALQARKITAAQQGWALKYAQDDSEGFKTFVAQAPEVMPGEDDRLKQPKGGGGGKAGLTMDELAVCKQLNLTPEAFKAERQAQQEA